MNSRSSRYGERGNAMVEAAMTLPILLLLMVGIFEVGRAYETWQVVTNAAREGARIAMLPNSNTDTVKAMVKKYMQDGQLNKYSTAVVSVNTNVLMNVNGTNVYASLVTVDYPFSFIMLNPVAKLIKPSSAAGNAITMHVTAQMRNEAQAPAP
jgi:Flp pilus assembly protein TadG